MQAGLCARVLMVVTTHPKRTHGKPPFPSFVFLFIFCFQMLRPCARAAEGLAVPAPTHPEHPHALGKHLGLPGAKCLPRHVLEHCESHNEGVEHLHASHMSQVCRPGEARARQPGACTQTAAGYGNLHKQNTNHCLAQPTAAVCEAKGRPGAGFQGSEFTHFFPALSQGAS